MTDIRSLSIKIDTVTTDDGLHWSIRTRREHDTETLDCWCNPSYLLYCDECESGCWKCDGGSSRLSREEAEFANRPLVIIHNLPGGIQE